jgi:hypothetical protein
MSSLRAKARSAKIMTSLKFNQERFACPHGGVAHLEMQARQSNSVEVDMH